MAQDLPKDVRKTLAEQKTEVNARGEGKDVGEPTGASGMRVHPRSTDFVVVITANGPGETFVIDGEDYDYDTLHAATTMPVSLKEEANDKYKLLKGVIHKTHNDLNGYPTPITDNAPGSANSFSSEYADENAKKYFEGLSEEGEYSVTNPTPIKGKVLIPDNNKKDYITHIIAQINENAGLETTAEYPLKTQVVLGKYNSRAPDKIYLMGGQKEEDAGTGAFLIQQDYGAHGTGTKITPAGAGATGGAAGDQTTGDANVTVLSIEQLKNIGLQLMIRASGEYFDVANMDFDNFAEVLAARATSLAPGLARLGLKVGTSKFDVDTLMAEINPNFVKSRFPELKGEENYSFGNVNNPMAPFDAFDSRSSGAAAAILIVTVTGLFEILSFVLGPSVLQSPLVGDIFGVVSTAVIPKTTYSFSKCVREGTKVFFGLGGTDTGFLGSLSGLVTSAAGRFNDEPGYYNVILRNVVKMIVYELFGYLANSIVNTFGMPQEIAGIPLNQITNDSGLEINPNIGLTKDPTNIMNSIRRLLQSRLIGFMNLLAIIGDKAMKAYELEKVRHPDDDQHKGLYGSGYSYDTIYKDVYSDEDKEKIRLSVLVTRNNLSAEAAYILKKPFGAAGDQHPLAWGSWTTPSAHLLPTSIMLGAKTVGGTGYEVNDKLIGRADIIENIGGRLDYDTFVRPLEDELEAAYVPFYFHDLRTNEITSFHAFLDSMSDGFDTEYTETTGYGRIGKVYTYKNTNRSISLSFYVVATNREDFDTMWWKINKLVTMMYPQYTAGRVIKIDDNNQFVQPFSQLPAASPLVRLRLGDILKSNFSYFNLARLFGAGNGYKKDAGGELTGTELVNSIERQTSKSRFRSDISKGDIPDGTVVTITIDGDQGGIIKRPANVGDVLVEINDDGNPMTVGLPNGEYDLKITGLKNPPSMDGRVEYYVEILVNQTNGNNLLQSALGAVTNPMEAVNSLLNGGGKHVLSLPRTQSNGGGIFDALEGAIPFFGSTNPPIIAGRRVNKTITSIIINEAESPEQSNAANPVGPAGAAMSEQTMDSATNNMFDPEKNPIFKSFDSTKGRGLAGFIKSLKFDWNQSTWRIDGLNHKAPQFLKIDMEFAPIHDLAPGLDANGFNSAPVYRIGDLSEAVNNSVGKDKQDAEARLSSYKRKAPAELKKASSDDPISSITGKIGIG